MRRTPEGRNAFWQFFYFMDIYRHYGFSKREILYWISRAMNIDRKKLYDLAGITKEDKFYLPEENPPVIKP
jgi:hypothetical protein